MAALRFPIRFDPWYRAVSRAVLLSPADAFVEVDGAELRIRMGWAFRARVPRAAVAAVAEHRRIPLSRGVHGWSGRWLVNGSGDGVLELTLDPAQRALVAGFPVRLRALLVSVDDPAGLRSALGR